MHKIEKAATNDKPADLFEVGTPSLLSRMFNLGGNGEPTKQINKHLDQIVRDANKIIQETFYEHTVGIMTTRRTHFDAHRDGSFTYLPITNNLPFRTIDMDAIVPVLPDVSIVPASPAWLAALIASL